MKQIIVIGFIDHGTGQHQSNTVYKSKGIIPALTTLKDGGTQQIKVLRKWKRKSSFWEVHHPQGHKGGNVL